MHKFIFSIFVSFVIPFSVYAQNQKSPLKVEDVETLNDNLQKYEDKKITVKGEVQDVIDQYSMVIESGGLINDEIVVSGGEPLNPAALKEDAQVEVTGTLRRVPVVEVQRELGRNFQPTVQKELKGMNAMIMVEKIRVL